MYQAITICTLIALVHSIAAAELEPIPLPQPDADKTERTQEVIDLSGPILGDPTILDSEPAAVADDGPLVSPAAESDPETPPAAPGSEKKTTDDKTRSFENRIAPGLRAADGSRAESVPPLDPPRPLRRRLFGQQPLRYIAPVPTVVPRSASYRVTPTPAQTAIYQAPAAVILQSSTRAVVVRVPVVPAPPIYPFAGPVGVRVVPPIGYARPVVPPRFIPGRPIRNRVRGVGRF